MIFLSTLPARGATVQKITRQVQRKISIHAPREGSDLQAGNVQTQEADFYPRSPRGERRCKGKTYYFCREFLSTLPARGATGRATGAPGPA